LRLERCPKHIGVKKTTKRKIHLDKRWVEAIMVMEPEDRYQAILKLCNDLGVRNGAIYYRLKMDFKLIKVGKYLVYAGIS